MAQDERSALIFAVPLDPHYGGRVPVRMSKISGAQNLSGWSEFPPAHWGLAVLKLRLVRFHSRAWIYREGVCWYVVGGRPKGLPYPEKELILRLRRGGACPSRKPSPFQGEGAERMRGG